MERLKTQARAKVASLEAKYSDGAKPGQSVVPWWEGPHPSGKFSGTLKQVDCLGKQARLILQGSDKKLVNSFSACSQPPSPLCLHNLANLSFPPDRPEVFQRGNACFC